MDGPSHSLPSSIKWNRMRVGTRWPQGAPILWGLPPPQRDRTGNRQDRQHFPINSSEQGWFALNEMYSGMASGFLNPSPSANPSPVLCSQEGSLWLVDFLVVWNETFLKDSSRFVKKESLSKPFFKLEFSYIADRCGSAIFWIALRHGASVSPSTKWGQKSLSISDIVIQCLQLGPYLFC